MADLRIADAPEIALENITGNEKIPTGGYGNSAVTINNIGQFVKSALSLATEEYVSNAVGQKENKITLTGLNLTPTSTLVEIQQTNNVILNTIHQDLLNRMEWIKDNATVITDHQALTNRSTFNTHPSSSISHNGTSNVSIEIEELKNDVLTINTTTIPELENDIVGKQDVIVNDNDLSASSVFSNVPSTNNSALNSSLQSLVNRDKFIADKIKTGLPPTFDSNFSTEIGGYPLNARLMLDNGDIVQNTIPNNTTNPNTDMTGWFNFESYQSDINVIRNREIISIFDFMTMDQFKTWKDNQTTYNVTFALQAALDDANTFELFLPQGTYLHSGLVCDKSNFRLYSNSYARSILLSDNTQHVAFHVAKNVAGVSGIFLDGIKLQGNSNNLRGIQLGDTTKYVQFCNLNNCMIDGFTKSDACDIYLGSVQELDIVNVMSWRGNIGIYKAEGGYGTSVRISGKAGYLGRHAKHGIKLDGQIDDIYVQDNVIEGNGLEGIYISDTAFKGTQGVTLHLQNSYLEANGNSGAGAGSVYIKGTSTYLKMHRVYSHACNFADNPNAPVGFKNIAGQYTMLSVSGSSNLLPNTIGLTQSFIEYNANLTVSSGDILQQLKDLQALTGNRVHSSGFNYLRAYQNSNNAQANLVSSVTFPTTPTLSSDITTLDDYREVSDFVPVVTGNGGTVSTATCRYTKIGNLVNFTIQLTTQNFTSTQGTTKVSLPHTQVTGATAQFMNNQTYAGGFALIASQAVNLPTLASQGSVATIYITGQYITTA